MEDSTSTNQHWKFSENNFSNIMLKMVNELKELMAWVVSKVKEVWELKLENKIRSGRHEKYARGYKNSIEDLRAE